MQSIKFIVSVIALHSPGKDFQKTFSYVKAPFTYDSEHWFKFLEKMIKNCLLWTNLLARKLTVFPSSKGKPVLTYEISMTLTTFNQRQI